jgi:DNA-binding response OmpR family regulator
MRRLRQKIEADPRRPALLVTEQSIGYRLVPGEP